MFLMSARFTTFRVSIVLLLSLAMTFTPVAHALEITVSDNGSGSDSEVNLDVSSTTQVEQVNNSNIENNVASVSNTGGNSVSDNLGDSQVATGNISEDLSIENNVNYSSTSIDCCPEEVSATIANNGADSQNDITVISSSLSTTSIDQSAGIVNDIEGNINTGENIASSNLGDVAIETGNIHVSGGITNSPINTSYVSTGLGGLEYSAAIFGNGAGSVNLLKLYAENDNNIIVHGKSSIENLVSWNLNTGRNTASDNNGDVSIKTGDIFLDLFIENIANIGGVKAGCCDFSKPSDPGDPGDPGDSDDGEEDEGGIGEEESESVNEDEDEDSKSGTLLAEAASTEFGQIIGLSDTSSEEAESLFFFMSIVMIGFGLKFIGESVPLKKIAKRGFSR